MKIAFLNSSLEPGRDGVGDYTRLLAQECSRQGHECCTIALNDRYVSEAQSDGLLHLRLPAVLPWLERVKIAQQKLTEFAPDWVSLQFVPYAFHPKGLVHGLRRHLLPLVEGRKTQIMFHELWIGGAMGSPLKHRAVGMFQKKLILSLVTQLTPDVIHTSNSTYVTLLQSSGVTALPLPLFGNVPVSTQNGDEWLWAELDRANINIAKTNRSDFWLGGFFGTLHQSWPPEPLLTALQEAAARRSRQIILLSIGRLGPGETLWDTLARQYSPQICFCKIGEQPAPRVSQYLNSLDFGIATSPYSLIGKSGSVAAMLDHGLPVIVNRDDVRYSFDNAEGQSIEPLLHKVDDTYPCCSFFNGLKRVPSQSRLARVATQMLNDLGSNQRHND